MRRLKFDAVVVGSGCAGFNCADWLKTFGVGAVAVVTENRTAGTSRNTGSDKQTYYKLSLAGGGEDGVYKMARTLFDGGCMDGDVALAEAANSVRSFFKLVRLGVKFPTNEYGEFVGYKTDHDPACRATSIGPYTSKAMTEVLERAVDGKGIPVLDRLRAVKVLTSAGRVVGLLCLDLETGEPVALETPRVVLATGGPATVYRDSVYPIGHNGASSLALEAGASFSNLSEWQYGLASTDFRWNVSGTYQQVLPRYVSVDGAGTEREFLLDAFESPEEMLEMVFLKGYEWPFDVRKSERGSSRVDLLVYEESVVKGRKVYLDFTREPTGIERMPAVAREYLGKSGALLPLPIARLRKMNEGAVSLYASHGIDLSRVPLRIAVCAQHNNGGVRVDADWQTEVYGLYAVGEAAGTLGVFRPGGSALNSTQVGGLRAARHIAYGTSNGSTEEFSSALERAAGELEALFERTHGTGTANETLGRYRAEMSENFAFLRDIDAMRAGVARIEARAARFTEEVGWAAPGERETLLVCRDTILMQRAVAAAMLAAAERYGSRGSALVRRGGKTIPENEAGRKVVLTVRMEDGKIVTEERAVRPLPASEQWFEKVWNEYRASPEGAEEGK